MRLKPGDEIYSIKVRMPEPFHRVAGFIAPTARRRCPKPESWIRSGRPGSGNDVAAAKGNDDMSNPLWRSLLYTPAHLPKFAGKAAGGAADVVILDLEDAVPPEGKEAARQKLTESAALLRGRGPDQRVERDARRTDRAPAVGQASVDTAIAIPGPAEMQPRLSSRAITET